MTAADAEQHAIDGRDDLVDLQAAAAEPSRHRRTVSTSDRRDADRPRSRRSGPAVADEHPSDPPPRQTDTLGLPRRPPGDARFAGPARLHRQRERLVVHVAGPGANAQIHEPRRARCLAAEHAERGDGTVDPASGYRTAWSAPGPSGRSGSGSTPRARRHGQLRASSRRGPPAPRPIHPSAATNSPDPSTSGASGDASTRTPSPDPRRSSSLTTNAIRLPVGSRRGRRPHRGALSSRELTPRSGRRGTTRPPTATTACPTPAGGAVTPDERSRARSRRGATPR